MARAAIIFSSLLEMFAEYPLMELIRYWMLILVQCLRWSFITHKTFKHSRHKIVILEYMTIHDYFGLRTAYFTPVIL